MDDLDHASIIEAENLKLNLSIHKPTGPTATGKCLTCGAKLSPGRRWCNADCRDEWELTQ
jgi:uncharacterized OB-fold protein